MRAPILITVLALLSGPGFAQDREAAEATVRAYYSARQKADWIKVADLLHPNRLKEFQRSTISESEVSLGVTGIRSCFSRYGVKSFDELRAMDARVYFLRSFKQGEHFFPQYKNTTIMIGTVTRKGDAYLVEVEVTSKLGNETFRENVQHRILKDGERFKVATVAQSEEETAKDQQGEEPDAGNADR